MTNTGNQGSPPLFRFDAATFQNPYPMFARLREMDPVHSAAGVFVLTRYADLVAVLKDPRFGRAGIEAGWQKSQGLGDTPMYLLPVMFRDPPDHTRLRAVLSRAFTLRVVEVLVPHIERVTNELLDEAEARGKPFELVQDLAYMLPLRTICYLLGMPADDHAKIQALSEANAAAVACGGLREETRELIERASRLRTEWAEYFHALAAERRIQPKEDIVSGLVRVHDGTDKLTEYELLATMVGLLFAGHTTTADSIATGTLALMTHHDQWELLVKDPELLDGAVEESLRWEPAVQFFLRNCLEDAEVAGVPIPKGSQVMPFAAAANRDPAQFSGPERFDITRSPNKHVTFGSGIHFCMGTMLARVQMKTVLRALRERYPHLALRGDNSWTFRPNALFRGVSHLNLTTLP